MTEVPLSPAFLGRPIAHRALHGPGAPENSRAAIAAAIEAGYGIEIDVQVSADGVPMVFHDSGLARLTAEDGPVRERTAAALSAIGLKGGDEGIPTLEEVFRLVAGRVPLLVELKDQSGDLSGSDGRFEASVAALAASYAGPLAFMSFNPALVAGMARAAPGVPRGRTTSPFHAEEWPGLAADRLAALACLDGLADMGAAFISHDWHDLASPRVAEVAAQGLPILCWTITNAADEATARRVAQNITFERYLPL